MERHFHEDLRVLKTKLLKMGVCVEEAINKAVKALLDRDANLAKEVFDNEKLINQTELEIDSAGHSLLALRQPMAGDLRTISMILKINTDLERMGDHAVNIAERAILLIKEPPFQFNVHLPEMADAAQKMLHDSLNAFIEGDIGLARSVLKRDDTVDAYNDGLYHQVTKLMEKNLSLVKTGLSIVIIGHNIERIADLANNIAEDVLYMKQGVEVRHRSSNQSVQ